MNLREAYKRIYGRSPTAEELAAFEKEVARPKLGQRRWFYVEEDGCGHVRLIEIRRLD